MGFGACTVAARSGAFVRRCLRAANDSFVEQKDALGLRAGLPKLAQ